MVDDIDKGEAGSISRLHSLERVGSRLRPFDQLLCFSLEELKLREVYFGDLRHVLGRILESIRSYDAAMYFPELPLEEITQAMEEVYARVPEGITAGELSVSSLDSWPNGLQEASERVYRLGFLLPWNHIPESEKEDVRFLFAKRKFAEILGDFTVRDLYGKALADCTPRERHVIKIGRSTGLLRRHRARPFSTSDPIVNGDKNDMACYDHNCYSYDDSYCAPPDGHTTGCNAGSDQWDPNAAPPIP